MGSFKILMWTGRKQNRSGIQYGSDAEALQIVLDSKFPPNVKAFVDSVPACDLKDQLSIYRTEVNTKVQQLVDEMLIGKYTPEETQERLIKEINAILAN